MWLKTLVVINVYFGEKCTLLCFVCSTADDFNHVLISQTHVLFSQIQQTKKHFFGSMCETHHCMRVLSACCLRLPERTRHGRQKAQCSFCAKNHSKSHPKGLLNQSEWTSSGWYLPQIQMENLLHGTEINNSVTNNSFHTHPYGYCTVFIFQKGYT